VSEKISPRGFSVSYHNHSFEFVPDGEGYFLDTLLRAGAKRGVKAELDTYWVQHGGADPVMLEQIFAPDPPDDPYDRTASHIDGAASILLGIAGAVLAISGLQMLCTGLIGEVLMRTYFESQGRPIYSIRDVLTSSDRETAV